MMQKVSLEKLLKEQKISQQTFDKVTIAKQIIERKYNFQQQKNTEWNPGKFTNTWKLNNMLLNDQRVNLKN